MQTRRVSRAAVGTALISIVITSIGVSAQSTTRNVKTWTVNGFNVGYVDQS